MACFDIHKLKAHISGQSGCDDIVVDQHLEVVVRPHHGLIVRIDTEFRIQQRMMVGNPWFHVFGRGTGKPARVCQLQAHDKVIRVAGTCAVGLQKFLA